MNARRVFPVRAYRSGYGVLAGWWCPCRKFLVVDGHAKVAAGDLTMCPGRVCGEVLILVDDEDSAAGRLGLRRLTKAEHATVTHEEVSELYRAAEFGRRRRRDSPWDPTPPGTVFR